MSMSDITIAPALIKGFRGIPFSASSWNRALNEVPEGSLPNRSQIVSPRCAKAMAKVKSLLTLWIEKRICQSPYPMGFSSSS